jgi:hypothetical protein
VKRDGTKARYPIEPSNLLLVELNIDDKNRLNKLKNENKKSSQPKTEQKLRAESKPEVEKKSKLNKAHKEDTK